MIIREYADTLFNEHSVYQQYDHSKLITSRERIKVLRDVCEMWGVQDYQDVNEEVLLEIVNEAEEILNTKDLESVVELGGERE